MTIMDKLSNFFNRSGGEETTTEQSKDVTISEEKSWEQDWIRAKEYNREQIGDSAPYATPWVYRAISVTANAIAQAPLKVYNANDEQLSPSLPISRLMMNPNQFQSGYEWVESLISYLLLNGEAMIYMNPSIGQLIGTRNIPAELFLLNPQQVQHSFDGNGQLAGWVYGDMPIDPDELIHLKLFNPSIESFRGYSPITALKYEMEADHSAAKYNNTFYQNQANPAGVIEADKEAHLDIKDLRKMKKEWYANHGGNQGAHRTAFLLNGLKYRQMGLSQRDMEFLQGRRFSRESIMAIYGVNAFVGGFYSDGTITRATALASLQAFYDIQCYPLMQRIEHKLLSKFFMRFFGDGIYGKFDTTKLPVNKSVFSEDTEAATRLFALGYTRNEISHRLGLNLPQEDDGNTRFLPMNLIPVGEDDDLDPEKSFEPTTKVVESEEKATKNDRFLDKIQKNYLRVQAEMEKRFESRLRKYLLKLRRESLRIFTNIKKSLTAEEEAEFVRLLSLLFDPDEMKATVEPVYSEAAQQAGEMALDNIGIKRPFVVNDAILQARLRYITEVNDTMFREIKKLINESIVEGDAMQTIEKKLKSKFNNWTNTKAKLVARTETASIMSAQTQQLYKDEGVQMKRWIATPDEKTRDTHRANEAQGAIPMGEKFSNGLLFPGDSENDTTGGGEVISCRCSLAPVIEGV